jgi:hypothetical protein
VGTVGVVALDVLMQELQRPAGGLALRDRSDGPAARAPSAGVAVTDRHSPDQIHGFAFMPAVIPAANHAIIEIAGLMRIQLDPA